jgi:hypothetical protein
MHGDMDEEHDDKVYYAISRDNNNHDVLWILANEFNEFFRECLTDYEWGLFRF